MKILIAQNSTQYSLAIAAELAKRGFMAIRCEKNGRVFASAICSEHFDAVVSDVFMAELDFVAAAAVVKSSCCAMPAAFVLSGFDSQIIEGEAKRAGAAYYFLKPFDAAILADRIAQFLDFNAKPLFTDAEKRVAELLQRYKVPPQTKGFAYLRDGIALALADESILDSMTRCFYPAIAKKNHATCGSVERAIRSAIEHAWCRCEPELIFESFGNRSFGDKPTNSEVVALIFEKLRAGRDLPPNTHKIAK